MEIDSSNNHNSDLNSTQLGGWQKLSAGSNSNGDLLSFLLTKADILTCLQNCDISARLVFKETKIKVNNYY